MIRVSRHAADVYAGGKLVMTLRNILAGCYYHYMTSAQQALVDARITLNLIKVRTESSGRIKAAATVKGGK